MICQYCHENCNKKGIHSNGKQRYQCKSCRKYQLTSYSYNAWRVKTDMKIKTFVKEGCGIRSISRILQISTTTVINRILKIATAIERPEVKELYQRYEVDELRTYVGNKKQICWVMYAMNKTTGQIIDLVVGRRTKHNISIVIKTLMLLKPKRINTDGLNIYPALIPKSIHKTVKHLNNHIERYNLTLRTHLKRLSRRTICFSRSVFMLDACVKIRVWG